MASIPKASIKELVKKFFGVSITEEGASEMVKILEDKAKSISQYAVGSAKKAGREKVTKSDIMEYMIKGSEKG